MQVRESEILFSAIVILITLAVTTFFIIRLLILNQRRIAIQQQEEAFRSVMLAEEKERMRIARDLHDSVGASLSVIKLCYSNLQVYLPPEAPYADQLYDMLDDACKEVRMISHNMMPTVLINDGLVAAIKNYTSQIQSQDILNFKLDILGEPVTATEDKSKDLMIYRIIQELVNNTLKHAQAKHVHLQLTFQPHNLIVLVEDDGIGMNESKASGIGLNNIQVRVNYLRGNLNIESAPTKGTVIVVNIPLTAPK